MKKLFAMVSALCMVCSAAALGEETVITTNGQEAVTTVTFEIKPNMDFTVTIPAEINVDPATKSGSVDFAIDAPDFEAEGWGVNVWLSAASGMTADEHPHEGKFTMSNENGNAISYHLKDQSNNDFRLGDHLLGWVCMPGEERHVETTLTLFAETPDNPAIGTYTDTLTFLVSLLEPPIG